MKILYKSIYKLTQNAAHQKYTPTQNTLKFAIITLLILHSPLPQSTYAAILKLCVASPAAHAAESNFAPFGAKQVALSFDGLNVILLPPSNPKS
jgi:hypothetical protein